jgi:hypothetical protein
MNQDEAIRSQMSPAAKLANRIRHLPVTLVLVSLVLVGIWTAFAAGVDMSAVFGTSAFDIAFAAVVLCTLMVSLVRDARSDRGTALVALVWLMTYTAVAFVLFFSQFYWSHRSGFSHPLTRLDAVYVTMGTLTGGTGDLIATSESVRAIQMVQELLDLVFVLFAVGVVVSRIGSRGDSKVKPHTSATNTQAPAANPEGAAGPEGGGLR